MGEWVLIWMIFQSELGTTIIAPPPIYFHDHAACEAKSRSNTRLRLLKRVALDRVAVALAPRRTRRC